MDCGFAILDYPIQNPKSKIQNGYAGHILYNVFGSILTHTLTAELEAALAAQNDLADPDTGLVHIGQGRWYDPALGRPLQPDPVGGVPTLPQSLNRYAATPLGAPGVAQAAGNDTFTWTSQQDLTINELLPWLIDTCLENTVCGAPLNKVTGLGTGRLLNTSAFNGVHRTLYQLRNGRVLSARFFPPQTRPVYGVEVFSPRPGVLDTRMVFQGYETTHSALRSIIVRTTPTPTARFFGKIGQAGFDNSLPFVVDIGFQLYQDWNNPYLTSTDRFGRAAISGFVGVGGGGLAYIIALSLVGNTPPGWLVFGTGIFVGIFFENRISATLNEAIFPEQRNLMPLE